MENSEFERIIIDIMASFRMEDILIPEEVIYELKTLHVRDDNKLLVRKKGDKYDDDRRK